MCCCIKTHSPRPNLVLLPRMHCASLPSFLLFLILHASPSYPLYSLRPSCPSESKCERLSPRPKGVRAEGLHHTWWCSGCWAEQSPVQDTCQMPALTFHQAGGPGDFSRSDSSSGARSLRTESLQTPVSSDSDAEAVMCLQCPCFVLTTPAYYGHGSKR